MHGEEKHIAMMATPDKIPIKMDRKVIFPNFSASETTAKANWVLPATNVVGSPAALLLANMALQRHPLYRPKNNESRSDGRAVYRQESKSLPEVMYFLKNSNVCAGIPLFLGMATVCDDLYWQLIENFFYTAVKYNVSQCRYGEF